LENRGRVRSIVLTGLFAATAVLLSGIHFPVGPIKAFPFQHMVNILAGVLIGPWYAALSALIAAIIRNAMGTGKFLPFHGGFRGAFWWDWCIVGLSGIGPRG